jgi:glycosyltransferase involved in cell wall biosynthesis
MNNFSISALLPVKNGGHYLRDSITSINENSSELSEIVVINDGSTDETSKILLEWTEENSKVRVIDTAGVGLVAALNLGVSIIQSDFIARFDVDDQYAGNRIELQRSLLSSETSAVFSDYVVFSSSRSNLGLIPSPIFPTQTSVSLVKQQRTPHPSAIINRSAMTAVGGYRAEDFPAEDLSLWLRLSRVGELKSVPRALLRYRLSTASVSSTQSQLMNTKRQELLSSIGINRSDFSLALKMFDSGQAIYEEENFSIAREMLHLLELKAACSHFGISEMNLKFNRKILKELTKSGNATDIGAVFLKGLERKIYKKFQL